MKKVPAHIVAPDYAETGRPKQKAHRLIRTEEEIVRLRKACRAAREVLEEVISAVKVGISTEELDNVAHEACIRRNGYPSPLNYHYFPKSLCTSINNVICHGIPKETDILKDGDIINCDVTIYLEGMHGDCSETVCVGNVSEKVKKLVERTKGAMLAGIAAAKPARHIYDIGKAIERFINKEYGIVKSFAGHGIGPAFHMPPSIEHYYNPKARFVLQPGMAITVEPMINLGLTDKCRILEDRWTAITTDGLPSAQFEHTILITKDGSEILTGGL